MVNFDNRTIWTGNNLDILRGLNTATVDLIYVDPPFNPPNRVGRRQREATFNDTWNLSEFDVAWLGIIAEKEPAVYRLIQAAHLTHGEAMQAYLCMIAVRLLEMHRVLKRAGSIYVHCDQTASHYLKILMDTIFESKKFKDEITWKRSSTHKASRTFANVSDTILFYGDHVNEVTADDETGANLLDNVWTDIPPVTSQAKQSVRHPGQKPMALMQRIIRASSKEGDIVLDPFCGTGTTCIAAESLGRQWIAIDLSPKAVETVNLRLQKCMREGFQSNLVTARTDIPQRTDIDSHRPYRQTKHIIFGKQEGRCGGCRTPLDFYLLEVDHILPTTLGGNDKFENLQLLCSHCNQTKADRPQEHLIDRLKELGSKHLT